MRCYQKFGNKVEHVNCAELETLDPLYICLKAFKQQIAKGNVVFIYAEAKVKRRGKTNLAYGNVLKRQRYNRTSFN